MENTKEKFELVLTFNGLTALQEDIRNKKKIGGSARTKLFPVLFFDFFIFPRGKSLEKNRLGAGFWERVQKAEGGGHFLR